MATEIALTSLDSWLNNQDENTPDTAYDLSVTGISTKANLDTLVSALKSNLKKYVDLTNTTFPNLSSTTLASNYFTSCKNLVGITAPVVSSSTQYMFNDCTNLKSIIFKQSTIPQYACYDCTNLQSVTVADSSVIYTIEQNAFYGCKSLETLTGFDSLTKIGNSAFYGCPNAPITDSLYAKATYIGAEAFAFNDTITSITIPSTVTTLGAGFAHSCKNLVSITVDSENTKYSSENNAVLRDNDLIQGCNTTVIPNSVTYIAPNALRGCTGLTGTLDLTNITSISEFALYGCTGLTDVQFNTNLLQIDRYAFYNCSGLTNLVLPESITTLGECAFENCSGIKTISIPSTLTSIGNNAFGFLYEDEEPVANARESITVASGNTVYDSRNDCNAIIKTSTNELLYGCSNTVIPDTVTSIHYDAFYENSKLSSIIIPASVTSLGASAFRGCSNLTTVTQNGLTTTFGDAYVFKDCPNLTTLTLYASPSTASGSIDNLTTSVTMYVPLINYDTWKSLSKSKISSLIPIVNIIKWIRIA